MTVTEIIYWASTGLVAVAMLFSAYAYLSKPAIQAAFTHLGYPAYFRIELAVAKAVGASLLLAPVGAVFKEWTYAGFAFTFVSAFVSHSALGDPVSQRLGPLFMLTLLAVSYATMA